MASGRGEDPKVAALREARALNPRPEAVTDEAFAAGGFLDARDIVQVKYEMVRRVNVDGRPVSEAAASFGFSRPSWYAAAAALDEGGLPGLLRARPGPAGRTSSARRSSRSSPTRSLPIRACGRPNSPGGSRSASASRPSPVGGAGSGAREETKSR